MATKVASLYAEISADTTNLKKGLDDAQSGLGNTAKGFMGLAGQALISMGVLDKFTDSVKWLYSNGMEAEYELARLEAVLQATGGAAGMTSEELQNLATELSQVSGVSDETILRGESILLTFRSIGEDIFPQATEAALDMSMAMGMDLQSAIVMVGKALNEPIQGIGALRRVGVQLTDEQEGLVKSFMEVNNLAGAQGVILDELALEFGGVSEALGNTLQGRIEQTKNLFGELAETLFADTISGTSAFLDGLNQLITTIINLDNSLEGIDWGKYNRLVQDTTAGHEEVATSGIHAADANGELADQLWAVVDASAPLEDGMQEVATAEELAEEQARFLKQAMADLNMVVGGQLGPEIENFTQTQSDLETEMGNVAARIEELSGKSWLTGAEREELENLRGEYETLQGQYEDNATAHEEATRRILFDLLTQRAAVDGLSGAELNVLTQIASEWGLVDDATADAAAGFDAAMGLIWEDENGVVHGAQAAKMAVMEVGDQYVDTSDESESAINGLITGPMSAWKTELLEVNGLVDSISGEYDIHFNVTSDPMPNIPNVGSGGGGEGGGGPVDPIRQAEGGDWWVTQPTLFLAGEAGPERATFTPAGEEMPGGGDTYYITINAGGGADGIELYRQFKQALENDLRASERGGVQTSDY